MLSYSRLARRLRRELGYARQFHGELRASILCGRHRDAPVMRLHDLIHDRQSQPGAPGKETRLQRFEKFGALRRTDAHSGLSRKRMRTQNGAVSSRTVSVPSLDGMARKATHCRQGSRRTCLIPVSIDASTNGRRPARRQVAFDPILALQLRMFLEQGQGLVQQFGDVSFGKLITGFP